MATIERQGPGAFDWMLRYCENNGIAPNQITLDRFDSDGRPVWVINR
jgi:type IV secretory pathway VirD2 relaxase